MENRVYCLYRVSTGKQVDYNDSNEADIPMQRRECHRFAEEHGWIIIHEEQEDGVSGHKVRAENRDKLQIIKEHARQGKFDILLVFMFDRIGRIADETPFVVEWFVRNGIRVWSCKEGEQRFDSHTDKLTNYIRFWQADGESEKTSIRTKTALGQLVEDGGFKGGSAPYGYNLVKSGRINKRKHEVFALAVNEAVASVVRMIFDKYVNEDCGAQRIATWLGSLFREAEDKCAALEQQLKSAQAAYDEGQALMASLNRQYDAIIGWPELYDGASIETKKMIVNCLIKRIDVYRGYRVHIDFNIDFEQFQFGLDCRREQEVGKKPA